MREGSPPTQVFVIPATSALAVSHLKYLTTFSNLMITAQTGLAPAQLDTTVLLDQASLFLAKKAPFKIKLDKRHAYNALHPVTAELSVSLLLPDRVLKATYVS